MSSGWRNAEYANLPEGWWRAHPRASGKMLPERTLEQQMEDPLFTIFNPDCKHWRCAHTILECEQCADYKRRVMMQRIEERDKKKAEGTKPSAS